MQLHKYYLITNQISGNHNFKCGHIYKYLSLDSRISSESYKPISIYQAQRHIEKNFHYKINIFPVFGAFDERNVWSYYFITPNGEKLYDMLAKCYISAEEALDSAIEWVITYIENKNINYEVNN